jgi:hypothetical protein
MLKRRFTFFRAFMVVRGKVDDVAPPRIACTGG